MVDYSFGKTRLVIDDERDAVPAWNISGGDDCKLVPWDFRIVENVPNPSACNRTADGDAVQHTRKFQVIHILGLTHHLAESFPARH